MYNDGLGLASTIGGSLDLNRSPQAGAAHLAGLDHDPVCGFRHAVECAFAFVTRSQNEFAISVGILYRFKMGKGPRYH